MNRFVNFKLAISVVFFLYLVDTFKAKADDLPPVGERVYHGGQEGKYGSLQIKDGSKRRRSRGPSSVIFRDPQLGTESVAEPNIRGSKQNIAKPKPNIPVDKKHKGESAPARTANTKKQSPHKSQKEFDMHKTTRKKKSKKSILDLGSLKISGRHKQPTIPFNQIPIHLEQSFEPLEKGFLDKVDDNLPGL